MNTSQTEILLLHDGAELARLLLPPGEYIVGRDASAHIRADTPLLSRSHARLTLRADTIAIEDLGSSNGTFVDDQPLAGTATIAPGQRVRLGDVSLELRREAATMLTGAPAAGGAIPAEVLAAQRYAIGAQVARGGMGAILDAQQAAMKRRVAMKVMLEGAEDADIARFVDEAQITGQLEHPNIVPVHELGVDEHGQLFYTMKFVRGITLKRVLELLADGVEATVKKYPLPALLTIFQKACDAVAFAHSKRVIHRDLKPENIMLGDFGEVLVMDWGLAKVIGHREGQPATGRSTILSTRKGDTSHTLDGTVMGTPQYMAPEQARGEVETMDQRADIYALGAILFHLLHLRPAVSGEDAWAVVKKVARGEVEWTCSAGGPPPAGALRQRTLHIPDSLLAVCRKAMALDPAQRYGSVAELQRDIEAFQNGFATSAERAGFARQLALLIKRNKAVVGGIAAVLVVGATLGMQALLAGRRAERALIDLKATAPDLLALAASEAAVQHFDSALRKADAALAVDPQLKAAYWRRAWLFVAQEKYDEARAALHLAMEKDPANQAYAALAPLLEKLAAAPAEKRYDFEFVKPLYDYFAGVGAIGEASPLLAHLKQSDDERLALVKERVEKWLGKPGEGKGAYSVTSMRGAVRLVLLGVKVGSLEPLRGLPLEHLDITDCGISDLSPLRGMRLRFFGAAKNNIEDLTPLEGMPLTQVMLEGNPVRDLSPLRGMPITSLNVIRMRNLSDISPLAGMPLESLQASECPITDFSVLRGMPLQSLNVMQTQFSDCSVLAGMPLSSLALGGSSVGDISALAGLPLRTLTLSKVRTTDYSPLLRIPTLESLQVTVSPAELLPLRKHPGLKQIRMSGIRTAPFRPVAEIWAEYDAQQAAAKK